MYKMVYIYITLLIICSKDKHHLANSQNAGLWFGMFHCRHIMTHKISSHKGIFPTDFPRIYFSIPTPPRIHSDPSWSLYLWQLFAIRNGRHTLAPSRKRKSLMVLTLLHFHRSCLHFLLKFLYNFLHISLFLCLFTDINLTLPDYKQGAHDYFRKHFTTNIPTPFRIFYPHSPQDPALPRHTLSSFKSAEDPRSPMK